jgi:cyclopropane-fatty-acyl-phospholipid synthase
MRMLTDKHDVATNAGAAMSSGSLSGLSPVETATVGFVEALTRGYQANFAVRLWTGATWEPNAGPPGFTLVLKHAGAVRSMFWPFNKVALGEAYIYDDFDIEGDILAFIAWLRYLVTYQNQRGLRDRLRLLYRLVKLPRHQNARDVFRMGRPRRTGQGIDEDRRGISYHYDRPGAFYRLFLGPTMQYTCSYFHTPDDDLDESQRRKMDYLCRKLRLRPGQRLLDIGCGWGGLLRHAAQHYGVTGVGVTLAGEQASWAEEANREAGLADRVRILYCDYRQMPFSGEFDAITSIGMTEEVGLANLPAYFNAVSRALKPGGGYLHHAINIRPHTRFPPWTAFARKYVFPNGSLQTLPDVHREAARAGLEVRDVENLREHYPLTLRNWVRRLEANREAAVALTDEVTYRIYRLYMAGATLGFDLATYQLNQTLFIKLPDGPVGFPLTRQDWYSSETGLLCRNDRLQ